MTALLQIVSDAREIRDQAEREFRLAICRAKERHSFREVAAAAGMTRAGVQHVLRRHREENGE